MRPGSGTVIAATPKARAGDRQRLLHQEVEQLVVEAKRKRRLLSDVSARTDLRVVKAEPNRSGERRVIVNANDLYIMFGKSDALRGLSMAVPEGSVFALIGLLWAGKTTTIKVPANLVRPITGSATVLGVDPASSRHMNGRRLAMSRRIRTCPAV